MRYLLSIVLWIWCCVSFLFSCWNDLISANISFNFTNMYICELNSMTRCTIPVPFRLYVFQFIFFFRKQSLSLSSHFIYMSKLVIINRQRQNQFFSTLLLCALLFWFAVYATLFFCEVLFKLAFFSLPLDLTHSVNLFSALLSISLFFCSFVWLPLVQHDCVTISTIPSFLLVIFQCGLAFFRYIHVHSASIVELEIKAERKWWRQWILISNVYMDIPKKRHRNDSRKAMLRRLCTTPATMNIDNDFPSNKLNDC